MKNEFVPYELALKLKQLGDVSQTILIPYDANDIIKNNVGNIFKTLNTPLQ